jgi:PIN domain nuclease of toxin-antitoxin system
MSAVVVDKHAAIWYLSDPGRLSPAAVAALDGANSAGAPIFLCSISLIEMCYLVEKGKIARKAYDQILQSINDPQGGLQLVPLDLRTVGVLEQIPRNTVPDMPDRIIAATALALNLPLISRDRKIQAASIQTIW